MTKQITKRVLSFCKGSSEPAAATRMRRITFVLVAALAIVCVLWAAPRLDEPMPAPLIRVTGAASAAPPRVASILTRACADCHSSQTRWPWYSKVPPVSWIVSEDVSRGRKAVNFSDWPAETNPARAATMLLAACADMQSGRMPLPGYRLLHPDSRLTSTEVDAVCQWTATESRRILEAERVRKNNLKQVSKVEHTATSQGGKRK